MTLRRWPDGALATGPAPALSGETHVARALLQELLDDDSTNDEQAKRALQVEYDRQAVAWTDWTAEQRDYLLPLDDLLFRWPSVVSVQDVVLDVGVGTGQSVAAMMGRCSCLLALDVSWEMIRRAPCGGNVHRLQGDVLRLPVGSGSVDVVLGLNAVPCWAEFDRVLAPDGRLVWLSSFGLDTPIVVSPAAIATHFRSRTVTWARAGHGFWVVVEGAQCTG